MTYGISQPSVSPFFIFPVLMMMNKLKYLLAGMFLVSVTIRGFSQSSHFIDLKAFHNISSHDLLEFATELSTEKYGGRLSGSPGYDAVARWVAGLLQEWGVQPGANDGSYFQRFSNPWTEVLHPGSVKIFGQNSEDMLLRFPDDYYPGSNSASGTVEGEVVYAGFGISAAEMGYDDYAGIDVRGKIVLIESGIPYSRNDPDLARWEPYSYHRYKFSRARELGATGLLYVGLVANPNTAFIDSFVYVHLSETMADELFRGTGTKFSELKQKITASLKPSSMELHRKVALTASTRHFHDAQSCNVIGIIPGSDPILKDEAIVLGTHLDGVGSPGMLFPGALDNASGVADLLGMARALSVSEKKPGRTIIMLFFGGEECGLLGSREYVLNPVWPKEKTLLMVNLDMVGNGTGFHLSGGLSFPGMLKHFEEASMKYLHRDLRSSATSPSYGRPRTDGAVFEKAGYITFGLWTTGTVKTVYYHQPMDNIGALTPEIMEDATKLLYVGVLGVSNDRELKIGTP